MNAGANCNKQIGLGQSSVSCDMCHLYMHAQCKKLNDDELQITPSTKRTLKLFYNKYDSSFDQFKKLVNSMKEFKLDISKKMTNQIQI